MPGESLLSRATRDYLAAELKANRSRARGRRVGRAQEKLIETRRLLRAQLAHSLCTRPEQNFCRILVAVDGDSGRETDHAVETAIALARQLGAAIGLVHVVPGEPGFTPEMLTAAESLRAPLIREGADLLKRIRARLPDDLEVEQMLRQGELVPEIAAAAREWKADVLVVGARLHGRLGRWFSRSIADALAAVASCPVLTVMAPSDVIARLEAASVRRRGAGSCEQHAATTDGNSS